MKPPTVSLDQIKQTLSYCPDTGQFTWLVSRKGTKGKGSIAGSINNLGYVDIRVLGLRILGHRLAVWYSTGKLPSDQVDHKNGIRSDNRIANLREASAAENKQNVKAARRHNKIGLLGFSFSKPMKKFQARIRVNNIVHRLGYFDSPEDAHQVYLAAKRNLHQFCTI